MDSPRHAPSVRSADASPWNPFLVRGKLSPRAYLAWGVALFALKFAIDAALVRLLLANVAWSPLLYVSPLSWGQVYPIHEPWQALVFGLVSLPFLWMGTGLTLRRLRDAGLMPSLVVVFVLPMLNLVFFLLLALVWPSRERPPVVPASPPAALLDEHRALHVALANVFGLLILGIAFAVSVGLLQVYGAGLFLCAPFLHGFAVALWVVPRGFTTSGAVCTALLGLVIALVLLLGSGREGVACLALSLPLTLPTTVLGAALGSLAAATPTNRRQWSATRTSRLLLLAPLVPAAEYVAALPPATHEVTSSIEIAATPDQVWPLVGAFPALPPPDEFLFRAGIAYPTSARIDGVGEGAVRHCTFNTGAFVEPITAWQPPHLLAFDVVDSPQPMIEWNPLFPAVDAPHLHGFFRARHGEFRLEALPGGRTRLGGTTWYSHGLQPEWYWRLWSDVMVHAIHARVLDHIATLAEGRR